jgi:hypothetical protein
MSTRVCLYCGATHNCVDSPQTTINATNYTVTVTDGTVDK